MQKIWMFTFTLFFMAACISTGKPLVPTVVPSKMPSLEAGQKSLPTPITSGQTIVDNNLHVTMSDTEITTSYLTEYDTIREPSTGKKIIWIHILLGSNGEGTWNLPAPEHFSIIDDKEEFKPTYGHRKEHIDYMSLNTTMAQGLEADGWLRFDIPADAEAQNLLFAFLPESTVISFGFSSSDYSWGDHPIYLWTCTP